MAHMIEDDNAFFVKDAAWHNRGKVLPAAPTLRDGCQIAYPYPLISITPEIPVIDAQGNRIAIPSETTRIIMRAHPDPTKRELGHVGTDYELVQPQDNFDLFEPLVQEGLITLESGFTLYEGKALAFACKVADAEAEVIKSDPVKGYVVLSTGFVGNLPTQIMRTATRVVCHNTLTSASVDAKRDEKKRKTAGKGVQEYWSFKHTSKIQERMQAARDSIAQVLRGFQKDMDVYKHLAGKQVSRRAQEHYVRRVIIGAEVEKPLNDQKISTNLDNKARVVIDLLDTQRGLELVPAARGTAWQAYNAVTQYLTHDYGQTEQSRLESNLFGRAHLMNREALDLAIQM